MWHAQERVEVRIGFWWGNLRKSSHLEELEKIIIKRIFKNLDGNVDEIDLAQDQDRLGLS